MTTQQAILAPKARGVDRTFAVMVTFLPPLAAALGLTLHFLDIYSISWIEIGLMVGMHFLCLTGLELGFHRLFSHRAYKASRPIKILLAGLGSMSFQGPVIWWASVHRKHHQFSDKPGDPHSMYLFGTGFWAMFRGFIHAHVGWIWRKESTRFEGWPQYVLDLYRDKDLFRIQLNYFYFMIAGFLIPTILGGALHGALNGVEAILPGAGLGLLWGGFVRIFAMNHLTFWSINTFSHGLGGRRYISKDKSTNFQPFAIPTLGQSLHNNHHAFANAATMSHRWWEIDPGIWILKAWAKLGWVSNLNIPSEEVRQKRLLKKERTQDGDTVSDTPAIGSEPARELDGVEIGEPVGSTEGRH